MSGRELVRTVYSGSAAELTKTQDATCPTGKKAIGGGFEINAGSRVVTASQSQPYEFERTSSWHVVAALTNLNGNVTPDWTLAAWAVCATAN